MCFALDANWQEQEYCESILFRGVFKYVEFVGKTIDEFKYPRYKIPRLNFRIYL